MPMIDGLPCDGRLWWLRWFDHPVWDGTTSTATVTLAVSQLPKSASPDSLPTLDAVLASSKGRVRTVRVHTGLIPAVAIGMVFRDGEPVGVLPAEVRPFVFERGACAVDVMPIRVAGGGTPLFGEDADDGAFAISRAAYALEGFDDCFCIRFRSSVGDREELVIPCCEVLRVLYAPHRAIALALTNGPWGETQWQVVRNDPEHPTRVCEDGTWHVSLAGGVGPEHLAVLANLVLDAAGREAANRVWASVITPSDVTPGRSPGGARPPGSRPGRLRAPIPFRWQTLELDVRGFRPDPCKAAWIGLSIDAFTWPPPPLGPPQIDWLPWRDLRRGKAKLPSDRPKPFGGTQETAGAGEGDGPEAGIRIVSDRDPSKGSQAVPVSAPGPEQRNAPRLVKAVKAVSYDYEGTGRRRRRKVVGEASTGNAVPGETGAATAQAVVRFRRPGSTRFAEVRAMLARLSDAGDIRRHWIVQPGLQEVEQRGDVGAWRLPAPPFVKGRRSAWYRLDAESIRSAMLCGIECGGSVVHWIELEMRDDESGYRSLLFTAGGGSLHDVAAALLKTAVKVSGRWPDGATLDGKEGVGKALTWTHSQVEGRLNESRALTAIKEVAGAALRGTP